MTVFGVGYSKPSYPEDHCDASWEISSQTT